MNITWQQIKQLSSSLYDELVNLIKTSSYDIINKDLALKLINESEIITYLINNFEQYEEAKQKIIEEFNNIIKKEIATNVSHQNIDFLKDFLAPYKKFFTNAKNKYKGIEFLEQLFDDLEIEPDLDLVICIYDNIDFVKQNIDNIAKINQKSIEDGTLAFSCHNNLLATFIEVYCLKNSINIQLEADQTTDLKDGYINDEGEYVENEETKELAKLYNDDYEHSSFQADLAKQIIIESKKYPVLPQDEIRALIEKAQNGSKYAKEKIVLHNQKLVIKILGKYIRKNMEFVDLFQEGCIGLTKAIDKFDLSKNFNFSTYTYWWIRQAITRALAEQGRTIRIPVHMTEKIKKFKNTQSSLYEKLGREATIEELAKAMHCKEENILELIQVSQDAISYNTKVGDEEDTELVDFISSETNLETDFDKDNFNITVTNFINSLGLTERQAYIALHRFDIPGYKKETLDVIGKKFNITRERIRQLEKKVKKIIFCSPRAKDFCALFPNPEKAYQRVLEERKKYYSEKEEVITTHPNLASKIGATTKRMQELISELNDSDQKFIASHYDSDFNAIEDNWEMYDDSTITTIITKIKRLIKDPNYVPQENINKKLLNSLDIDRQILKKLTPKLSIVDQQFIYNIFDEDFNLKNVTLNMAERKQLLRIIEDYKKMIDDPEYDPKASTNLANILGITYEELDVLTTSVSRDIQRFLMKHYDENWNERTKKTTDEKDELVKIIDLLQKIKESQKNELIKQTQIATDINQLSSLELIIVMGLIAGNDYNISYIAEFLNLDEEFIAKTIKEQLLSYKDSFTGLLSKSYVLMRTKSKNSRSEETST